MPIAGPRTQQGPIPGYRNPDGEVPNRFNNYKRPGPIWWPGRSPGLMTVSLRGEILGYGQIRRMYRQAVNLIPAMAPFSWSQNGPGNTVPPPVGVTRALRYMTRSVYMGAGIDNSRFNPGHTQIVHRAHSMPVTVGGGNSRGRPTVRNRMSSFGSRVPTLNQSVPAAENQNPGPATQA